MITDFFKDLTAGKYNTGGLAFPNWVLKEQRKHLISAMKEPSKNESSQQVNRYRKGVKVMNAIRLMNEADEERKANR